ncbi:hypothetical protein SDC9_190185 [bioreactor metagenome]|uniref:Uncharacterized protein n=1 Tax=bioreactor metagenome TaxID=1076179 RepID=A0A645HUB8_9ZZZZ
MLLRILTAFPINACKATDCFFYLVVPAPIKYPIAVNVKMAMGGQRSLIEFFEEFVGIIKEDPVGKSFAQAGPANGVI